MADEKGKSALAALAQKASRQLEQLEQPLEANASASRSAIETESTQAGDKEKKDRRIKSYSMDNDLIVGIEQLKLQAALNRENLSASDVVNEAVREYLRRKGVAV